MYLYILYVEVKSWTNICDGKSVQKEVQGLRNYSLIEDN